MEYVYHFVPSNMTGSTLFPLNSLKTSMPEVYASHVKKYVGRDWIFQKRIERLNCLWNDALHLSPIHPQIIFNFWRKSGFLDYSNKPEQRNFVFRIPINTLNPETTICYCSDNFDFTHHDPTKEKWWSLSEIPYREEHDINPDQIRVWHEDKKAGRRLFWYSHTTHILAKQTIDIRGCEILDYA